MSALVSALVSALAYPTVTVETRKRHRLTVFRLQEGLYLSGCGRFLYERRDRKREYESAHNNRLPYSWRRLRQGWAVWDLASRWSHEDQGPLPLFYERYPETLRDAVEHVEASTWALDRVDELMARGVVTSREQPLSPEAWLAANA